MWCTLLCTIRVIAVTQYKLQPSYSVSHCLCINVCPHTCVCMCLFVCMHACVCMSVYMFACLSVCLSLKLCWWRGINIASRPSWRPRTTSPVISWSHFNWSCFHYCYIFHCLGTYGWTPRRVACNSTWFIYPIKFFGVSASFDPYLSP